ncbi:MAG TPA: xylulokinase [Thermomicrobiales bacterium]|jgi:xylulokinase
MSALLGIDLGTGSVKAVIVAPDGRVLGRGSAGYSIRQTRPGWAEQEPEDWWRGTVKAVRAARVQTGEVDVLAVGLSGQMHGTVLLDGQGRAIGPAIIWADTRSAEQVADLTNRIGAERLVDLTGSPLAVGFQAGTIRWIQPNQPDRWDQVTTVLLPKDYLGWRLTHVSATEPSDASGTLLFDVRTRDWSEEILSALDLRRGQLPTVDASTAIRGYLSDAAAAELGLRGRIPVVGGGADAPLAALAAGVIEPDAMLLTISSGSQVIVPTDEVRVDRQGRMHTWCSCFEPPAGDLRPGPTGAGWYQMGATMVSGLALRWLQENVFGLRDADAYDDMTNWAARAPVGADGLIFLPYLAGERTPLMDPYARGLFLGLTTAHDRSHLTRAVMEGATLALYDAYGVLGDNGAAPRRTVLAGGGARSAVWRQIVADVFGVPIRPLADVDGSALGAALLAGVGIGLFDLATTALAWAHYGDAVLPDPAAHERYQRLLPIFREAYVKHRGDFRALADMAGGS